MLPRTRMNSTLSTIAVIAMLALTGCGGGGGSTDTPANPGGETGGTPPVPAPPAPTPSSYSVGGRVNGLIAGTQLTLLNHGGDPLTIKDNGAFVFGSQVAVGGSYSVAVGSAPAGQSCSIGNASGVVTATIDLVMVNCSAKPAFVYAVTKSGASSLDAFSVSDDGSLRALAKIPGGGDPGFDFVTAAPSGRNLYVSGYAALHRTSGVNQYSVAADGSLTYVASAYGIDGDQPGQGLQVAPSGRFAYLNARNVPRVSLFTVDGSGLMANATPDRLVPTFQPTSLTIDAKEQNLYLLDGAGQQILQYTVGSDGQPSTSSASSAQTGINPSRVVFAPSGRSAYSLNGDGTVSLFSVDSNGGLTTSGSVAIAALRDMLFNAAGTQAYAIGSDKVYQFNVGSDGALVPVGPGVEAAGDASGSTASGLTGLALDPTGRYLFVTDKGLNAIVTFAVSTGASPTRVATMTMTAPDSIVSVAPN